MKILIIEDEEVIAKVLERKLSSIGFDIKIANTGDKGYPTAKEFKPDLILLDLILPGKTGFQVLEALKTDAELQLIPVVILSNLDQEEDVKKALQLGAKDYLVKAHHPLKEIVEKIKTYLYQK